MPEIVKEEKLISPNKLPFLQSQILQILYINLSLNKQTNIDEISKITDYKPESKIINDAIKALNTKKFIFGDIENGYEIPKKRLNLYKTVVAKNDY
ncbi:MAG: hypothetical protein HOF42_04270, partial [Candidatus Marinimicrobia bacterium]|nr:hypothetical protein [Candidatus Neomarinimicrobiota bacterium]